jgi:polyphosphate glucokinase
MQILSIDIGGTNVKLLATGQTVSRKFPSGPALTAAQMVEGVKQVAADWKYDAVSVGYPGPVLRDRPFAEPANLGKGWVCFDFEQAFGCKVRIINDAAMQALGSYHGGKMLFLGLGTGLGSALVTDGQVDPMELAHLPYRKRTFEDYVGLRGLERLGKKKWKRYVFDVVDKLKAALLPEYIVIGGGNVRKLDELPPDCERGDNKKAFLGGYRLWLGHEYQEPAPAEASAAGGSR